MANTVALIDKKRSVANWITFVFQILVSGSYVTSTTIGVAGETINFNGATNTKKIARPKLPGAPAGVLPPNSRIRVTRAPDGYDALVEQNATLPTQANYVMRLFTSGDTALGSGAYAAGVTADLTGFIVEVDVQAKYN
jgi:hypothetical protein